MNATQTETEKDRQMIEGEPDDTHESDGGDAFSGADSQDDTEPEKGEGAKTDGLFDAARYDDPELRLPKVDGEGVDKIAVKFTGTVFLDRSDKRDVELMRKMRLGSDITLMVEGRCQRKGHGFTTDKEGDLDVVKLEHAVAVHSLYQPAGESVESD